MRVVWRVRHKWIHLLQGIMQHPEVFDRVRRGRKTIFNTPTEEIHLVFDASINDLGWEELNQNIN